MSILSQNLTKVLYFLKFLVFFSKRNTASHMIQADLETSDDGLFFVFFFVFLDWSFHTNRLHWTSLNFTESHWSSLKFTVNTWARGKSSRQSSSCFLWCRLWPLQNKGRERKEACLLPHWWIWLRGVPSGKTLSAQGSLRVSRAL